MAVGLKEISEKLQLSRSTVSRALNNKQVLNARGVPYISAKTVARVLKASKEMGYRPNHIARSLALGKTMRIAFWIPEMTNRFFQEIACKFHDYLRTFEYEMILCEFNEHMLSPGSALGLARADVDGVFLYGGDLSGQDEWRTYASRLAIVNMGIVQYNDALDYLQIDAYPAIIEALEHLLKINKNRIVHALCHYTKYDGDPRYHTYVDVLKKAGKPPEFLVIETDAPRKESSRKNVCEYIKANGCPDAFFCAEDEIAIGVYRGVRDLGFKIPEDVAIIGCDGIAETEYFDPSISTIAQPMDEICVQAWQLLSRRMKKEDIPHQKHFVKAKFLSRGSSQSSN